MYDLGDAIPGTDLDPGTNLLVVGPPMSGKRGLALRLLARGTEAGEGAIVVTTKDGADRILSQYEDLVDVDLGEVPLGIVDCVTKQQGLGDLADDERIRYTSSPVDMTGIGINLSEYLESFYRDREIDRNRVLLHSLSTLLMYSNLQTVFRFLHVFTGRVQSAEALGIYVIDSTAHDDRTMNTLKQLFDGLIEVSESDPPELKLSGVAGGTRRG